MPTPTIMDPNEAYDLTYRTAYAEPFFTKLARDYGIQPRQGTNDVEQMLQQAAVLRQAHDAQIQKQAASRPDLIAMSGQAMSQQFGVQFGQDTGYRMKAAAAHMQANPKLAHAVLSMELAIAQQQAAK